MSKNTKIILIVVAILLVLLIAAECQAERISKESQNTETINTDDVTVAVTDPLTPSEDDVTSAAPETDAASETPDATETPDAPETSTVPAEE